jgi:predicted nuclease with TOPRIM domain
MNLYELTKEELVARCKKLQSENERLQDELDRLSDCYISMENQLADVISDLDSRDIIEDVNWFKWRLQLDNLLTPELESFIEDYLKFNNQKG